MKIPKVCQYCGQEFVARTTVTQYCSDNCAKRAYKKRKREEKMKAVLELMPAFVLDAIGLYQTMTGRTWD